MQAMSRIVLTVALPVATSDSQTGHFAKRNLPQPLEAPTCTEKAIVAIITPTDHILIQRCLTGITIEVFEKTFTFARDWDLK